MFFEGFGEVAGAFKAAEAADLQNRLLRMAQEEAGSGNAVVDQILHGGDPQDLPEGAEAFPRADIDMICQLSQGDGTGIVVLKI